jgi:hypothetical protein
MLDPSLNDIKSSDLRELDDLISDTFGDDLITPSSVISNDLSLQASVQTHGWPLLSETLGKVMVVVHAGSFIESYVSLDPTFETLHMFPSVYSDQIELPYAVFVIENNPLSEMIPLLVQDNFMVRTRIDTELSYNDIERLSGIQSGAHILTSDFSIARKDITSNHIYYLDSSFTVRKRD